MKKKIIIIGAGPAGLAAAVEFKKNNLFNVTIIEKGYQKKIDEIKKWLSQIKNFIPIGRTGMFKYNNQDHAILTGLIGARKICDDNSLDPWLVNIDAEYHEEKS